MIDFKILVVDDEEEFRDVYRIIFEDKEYETHVAASGEECLFMLNEQSYDLVITDLKMGGMDGIELLNSIKEKYTCEVIIVTGYGTINSAVNAMKLGAFSYFIKGSDPEILMKEIAKLVKIKQLEKNNKEIRNQLIDFNYLLDSNCNKFINMLKIAERAAVSNSNILIL